ncbi:MAG: hypothetical protein S4CHLAM20_06220 [Chlamydiia bacterium]|nr:hypothetical protein [Chlamydiia bacterium]
MEVNNSNFSIFCAGTKKSKKGVKRDFVPRVGGAAKPHLTENEKSFKRRAMKDHILVITENKTHELILKKKLLDSSLIFLPSHNFAKERLEHLRFSFIIIDETEAEKKTLHIVDAVKKHPNTQASPILVITGKLNQSYLERLIHHGVSNFLSLPLADENIYQTLKDTSSGKKANEIISQMKIPVLDDAQVDIDSRSVIDQEAIGRVKKAFINKSHVALALLSTDKKPLFPSDLVMEVSENLFCIISLIKNKRALLDDILQIKNKNAYAGIVSSEDFVYDDIALMIKDAKQALQRAKETPNGISFFVKK